MSRNKGTFNFAANFEILTKAPLDARSVVSTKSDLIDPSIWRDPSSNIWIYKGMTVSVTSDTSTNNNGFYFLLDETQYTNYDYWLKLNKTDSSGTSSLTFELNNGSNGVVLKDSSGNLEVVQFDNSTYANIRAGSLNVNSLKIDSLNGVLYVVDGSVYSINGLPLKTYDASIIGNNVTADFTIDHSLNTLRQSISVYDNSNYLIYPDIQRGLNSDIINFADPIPYGLIYEIIILGF